MMRSKKQIFEDTLNAYEDNKESVPASMRLTINLHHLMKKQTILATVAIGSTMCWYVVLVVVEGGSLLAPWDVVVNCICAWLMLGSSNKYWIMCTKYGLCCCCYRKRVQKVIQSKLEVITTRSRIKTHSVDNNQTERPPPIRTEDYTVSKIEMNKARMTTNSDMSEDGNGKETPIPEDGRVYVIHQHQHTVSSEVP